jgi:hypothetical protein
VPGVLVPAELDAAALARAVVSGVRAVLRRRDAHAYGRRRLEALPA